MNRGGCKVIKNDAFRTASVAAHTPSTCWTTALCVCEIRSCRRRRLSGTTARLRPMRRSRVSCKPESRKAPRAKLRLRLLVAGRTANLRIDVIRAVVHFNHPICDLPLQPCVARVSIIARRPLQPVHPAEAGNPPRCRRIERPDKRADTALSVFQEPAGTVSFACFHFQYSLANER